jgi:hypothetical protein
MTANAACHGDEHVMGTCHGDVRLCEKPSRARPKVGVDNDASINNPDMARNFDDYDIESLQVPTLILQAKDDHDRLNTYDRS